MAHSQRILIAGAGIGGLTLAAVLRRQGFTPVVFERAPDLRWAGAGITVQSNALTALRRFGLDGPIKAAGQAAKRSRLLDPKGDVLSDVPVSSLEEALGEPVICLHRARLQQVLLSLAGADSVRLGSGVTGFQQDAEGVTVRLADGSEERGDFLIGADGLWSSVRQQLVGDAPPRYAGYTSWRGVAPAGGRVEIGDTSETWGAGLRFGIVSIGWGEVYWFAVADAPAGGRDEVKSVHRELLAIFGGWHEPVKQLIESTPPEQIIRTDICDREPLRQWAYGRVALLGDAAHPMTPNLGQGGCQAIEDAVVLATCLAEEPATALASYQRRRIERANWFVEQSWRMGQIAQLSHPVARTIRDAVVRITPPSAALRSMRGAMHFVLDG